MMPRYIDADKLNIKKATMWFDDPNDRRSVERMIREAPTVDAVPVVHGRWERIGIRDRKGLQIYPCCSACGMVSAAYRSEWERGAWKFCPNCGAKMDEEPK